jgi:hypothetical protein
MAQIRDYINKNSFRKLSEEQKNIQCNTLIKYLKMTYNFVDIDKVSEMDSIDNQIIIKFYKDMLEMKAFCNCKKKSLL